MLLRVYLDKGALPLNRGALFDEFVFQLLKREGLADDDQLTAPGQALSKNLEALAWAMQSRAGEAGESRGGLELTIARSGAVSLLSGETNLRAAANANLLEDGEPVRFTHQLLQEYFTARRMLVEIDKGTLDARSLWPNERWWRPSGWEEPAVLALGMSGDKAEKVLDWLTSANPDVVARALHGSGVQASDAAKIKLRDRWLPEMTDVKVQPNSSARQVIGSALGTVTLSSGEPLDNRSGVGLARNGVPEFEWVQIRGGAVTLKGMHDIFHVNPFQISRYLVTNEQFQAFVDADDGYRLKRWWVHMVRSIVPQVPRWTPANHPRESVSWYEAVAYCRWLTHKKCVNGVLGSNYEIRLPTEWEWQQAATNGNPANVYPWGSRWDDTRGYHFIGYTTAVGIFPHDTWINGPLDMVGNIWEWCLNTYANPHSGASVKINKSIRRAIRGGSWFLVSEESLRCSKRDSYVAEYQDANIGLRPILILRSSL